MKIILVSPKSKKKKTSYLTNYNNIMKALVLPDDFSLVISRKANFNSKLHVIRFKLIQLLRLSYIIYIIAERYFLSNILKNISVYNISLLRRLYDKICFLHLDLQNVTKSESTAELIKWNSRFLSEKVKLLRFL